MTRQFNPKLPDGIKVDNPVPGIYFWRNPNNRISVVLWHYSANPNNDEEWQARKRIGMSPDDWEREFEINFEVQGAFRAVFAKYFSPEEHIKENLIADPQYPVIRGIDFGRLYPACVFLQIVNGQVRVLAEIQGKDMLLRDFCLNEVIPKGRILFPNMKFETVCDIAGKQKSDKSNYSSIDILEELGFEPKYNYFFIKEGINIIEYKLTQRINGEPGLVFHPSCKMLITAFEGGYRWAEDGRKPLENEFCHLMDALRYCINYYIPNYHTAIQQNPQTQQITTPPSPDMMVFADVFLRNQENPKQSAMFRRRRQNAL